MFAHDNNYFLIAESCIKSDKSATSWPFDALWDIVNESE